jgi:hypothetical protein
MNWSAITEHELLGLINEAYKRMNPKQRMFWEQIAIDPEKWTQHPYGDEGGGFWVVAVMGRKIIWYNDIEEGWNSSAYSKYGAFSDYCCNQDELEWVVEEFRTNQTRIKLSGPMPL